jgi:hypothetical protein
VGLVGQNTFVSRIVYFSSRSELMTADCSVPGKGRWVLAVVML